MRNRITIHIYRDSKKEWRWRMKRCGHIIADSAESYERHLFCERAVNHLMDTIAMSGIVVEDDYVTPTK